MIVYLFDELSNRARRMRSAAFAKYADDCDYAAYKAATDKARKLEDTASRCRSAGVVPVRSQSSFAVDNGAA
jgi:hypothetical protein